MQELRDRVAVVTGGASGVGRALARALLGEGMKLVLADVERPALEARENQVALGGDHIAHHPEHFNFEVFEFRTREDRTTDADHAGPHLLQRQIGHLGDRSSDEDTQAQNGSE